MNSHLIQEKPLNLYGKVRVIKTKAGTKEVLSISEWFGNLIMLGTNTGKSLILQRLIGTNTYSLNLTHGEIGTGQTAVAISDTALTTPTLRTAFASGSISSNVATALFFFADASLANGTYYEFGAFVDGTSTIGTGQLFEHALFGVAYTKATGEDTTVQLDITLT